MDDNGEEVAYMLAELMHQVFIKGFNSAEVRSPHQDGQGCKSINEASILN